MTCLNVAFESFHFGRDTNTDLIGPAENNLNNNYGKSIESSLSILYIYSVLKLNMDRMLCSDPPPGDASVLYKTNEELISCSRTHSG